MKVNEHKSSATPRRALAVILALVMCFSALPLSAQAEDTVVTSEKGRFISEAAQTFLAPEPNGPDGQYYPLGFAVEPHFFADGYYFAGVTEITAGQELAFSMYMGDDPSEVTLVELFSADEPSREYALYKNGQVFYGGKIDNAEEGPGFMTGFSTDEFEPGAYYLKVATKKTSDGTTGPALTIKPPAAGPVVTAASPPSGKQGEAYSYTFKATPQKGGAITWSVLSGSLPAGLKLNSKTGVLSGTPTAGGTYTFTLKAAEAGGSYSKVTRSVDIESVKLYTVSFDLDGGKAAPGADYSAKSFVKDASVTLPAAPVKSGFKFVYWINNDIAYLPGATVSVTSDVVFTAEYAAGAPLSVGLPEGLDKAVGALWLEGTDSDGDERLLWSDITSDQLKIEVPSYNLRDLTFKKLELLGYVDGAVTALAYYNGEVSANTGSVTLKASGVKWQPIQGVKVNGVDPGDYYVRSVETVNGGQPLWLPAMTAGAQFRVYITPERGSEAAAKYDLEGSYTSSAVSGGMIVIDPLSLSGSAEVTIAAEVDGAPFDGTISASQTVNGGTRTVSGFSNAYSDAGRCKLRLYPGVETRFSLKGWGWSEIFIFEGETLSSPENGGTHNIKARAVSLDADISFVTDSDPAPALRYIKYLTGDFLTGNDFTLKVTPKGAALPVCAEKNACPPVSAELTATARVGLDYVRPDDAVTVGISSACVFDASADARLKDGAGFARISAKLKPGVVASLSADTSSECFFAWFDAKGKYIGCGDTFYLVDQSRDVASVCPAARAGSYTVAVLPHNYHSDDFLSGKTLSDLSAQFVTSWPVTLSANGVRELSSFRAVAQKSENAAFVTKPYSTMQANREGFSAPSDVIRLSGMIGLDPGLKNGRLEALSLDLKADKVTAYVSSVTVGGTSYPLDKWKVTDGSYRLVLPEPVALPCSYSFYVTPASPSLDVQAALYADVGHDFFFTELTQKVGSVRVVRPGASISTFSTYVCDDEVEVSGAAKPDEKVRVYDNGEPVAVAVADWKGEWLAMAPLSGTDGVYTTVHQLYAVSASGVTTDPVTVVHRKNGPQLTALNLVSNGIEYSSASLNAGRMKWVESLKFRMVFKNPDELETMPEWNAKAALKVYFGSGNIVFYAAKQQKDGSFVADIGSTRDEYIDRVEAMYLPKNGREDMTQNRDGSYDTVFTTKESDENAAAMAELRKMLASDGRGRTVLAGNAAPQTLRVVFDSDGKATCTGSLTRTVPKNALEKSFTAAAAKCSADVLRYKEISSGIQSGANILEWLNAQGDAAAAANGAAGDESKVSFAQRSQVFSSKTAFDNTKKYLSLYATDPDCSSFAAGKNHVKVQIGKNTVSDVYTISDFIYDDDGIYQSGTYRIVAVLTADTGGAPAIYTAFVTAQFMPDFGGFTGLSAKTAVSQKTLAVLPPLILTASADDVDASGLFQFYGGNFKDDPAYEQSSAEEAFSGDLANYTNVPSSVIGAAGNAASGFMSGAGSVFGAVSIGASIYNLEKTWDNGSYRIGTRIRMKMDLETLISSTCYKRLTKAKKQLVEHAMEKFMRAQKAEDDVDAWYTGLGIGCNVSGVLAGACSSALGEFGVEFAIGGLAISSLGWINGATLGKAAGKARAKTIKQYEESYRTIKSIFSSHAQQTGLDDCKKLKKDDGNSKTYDVNHDPSGIVYEGVIENPVKNATVTLWYAVDGDGLPVTEADAGKVKKVIPASAVDTKTPAETVQLTGADGKYAWFVPQGLWYVTAEKNGLSGNSGKDAAAVVKVSGVKAGGKTVTKLLPVLPEQLDVNIPLTDKTPPVVESVRYTDEGIYVTFSKYMADSAKGSDSVLDPANYTLQTAAGNVKIGSVKAVEQGHTPSNIDGANTKTYTRTVLIVPKNAVRVGTLVLLTVKQTVKSYAGSAMATAFRDSGTVEKQKALPAPVIGGGKKQTVEYGGGVTITPADGSPENTKIYYTVNGEDPAVSGRLYEGPFGATNDMTVKAVAVCPGYKNSGVASAEFVIGEAHKYMAAGCVLADGADTAGITLTLSGDGYKESVRTDADGSYAFHDVPVGSYTLSFAGNGDLHAASAAVTVSTFDPWVDLRPEPVNTVPAYTPGDVNADGQVLANDARLALRASAKLEVLTDAQILAADVNEDGQVLANDARQILRYSAQLQREFVKS